MTETEAESRSSGAARVVTALIAGPVFLGAVYLGGLWLLPIVAAIAVAAVLEVGAMFETAGAKPYVPAALLLALVVIARLWIPMWPEIVSGLAVALVVSMPFLPGRDVPKRIAATFFVVLYPAWFLSFLLSLREGASIALPEKALLGITILVILLVWTSDTGSYYAGRMFGKTPFFPSISPKKTWEGFAGGLILTFTLVLAATLSRLVPLSPIDAVALALICGLATPAGDLVESKLKRSFGVKDSGSILPGHGGVLDRFDGMVMTLPLVWTYLMVSSHVVSS